jgi:hypothetical protein
LIFIPIKQKLLPMASGDIQSDESLYPIAVLIDELRNEDVQVNHFSYSRIFFITSVFFLYSYV